MRLPDPPLIAILRGVTPSEAPAIAEALVEGGIRCLEVTLNTRGALASLAAIRARLGGRAAVGAGTVLCIQEVRAAAAAGAQFVVSPDMKPEVIAAAKAAGLFSLPGVFTPSEAFAALSAGADALKLFPAEAANPAALKALLAVLPEGTAVLPVGGIEASSLGPWTAAGAAGFGVGSALFRPGLTPIEAKDRARALIDAWNAVRPGSARSAAAR